MAHRPKNKWNNKPASQRTSPLCALPTEIRVMVLREVVVASRPIFFVDSPPRSTGIDLSILRTCQLIHKEGTNLFYAESPFGMVIAPKIVDYKRVDTKPPFANLRSILKDKDKRRALKNARKLLLWSSHKSIGNDLRTQGTITWFLHAVEDSLGLLHNGGYIQDKEVLVGFTRSIRSLITRSDTFDGKRLVGVFELMRCKKFKFFGVEKKHYEHIHKLIESKTEPLNLPERVRGQERQLDRARLSAGVPIVYDGYMDIETAQVEIWQTARVIDIPGFLRHKKTIDEQIKKFNKRAAENMERQNEHILTYVEKEAENEKEEDDILDVK